MQHKAARSKQRLEELALCFSLFAACRIIYIILNSRYFAQWPQLAGGATLAGLVHKGGQ